MDVQSIPGQKSDSCIWFGDDGWYYHRKSRPKGQHTYYCIWRTRYKCGGKALSNLDGSLFRMVDEHRGHDISPQYHETLLMENRITDMCLQDMSLKVADTIDQVSRQ